MNGSGAKRLFFLGLSLIGGLLCFAVYQIPQTWRGIIVAWLVVASTAGVFVLRLVGYYVEYRTVQLNSRAAMPRTATRGRRRRSPSSTQSLRVITADETAMGRRVL
ncbi:MAG: hypothetical protein FJZ90_17280 [Chloroflexi bacterium]|nr:hypothetical protein [Chloroflexota bacterium]